MSQSPKSREVPTTFPVSVLMERREVTVGRWSQWQWEVLAVVAGEEIGHTGTHRTVVASENGREQSLWTGLRVELFKDCCEGYWYNLMSGKPYLFVVCYVDEDDAGEERLIPALVTADQQEATGHMETDDHVYSVPMPEQVHEWLERYVVAHYVPAQKKKRKRREWAKESEYVEGAEQDRSPRVRQ